MKKIRYGGKRIKEHRHIMAEHLGRQLTSEEHIFFIDGDNKNIRPYNMKLMTETEHKSLSGAGKKKPRIRKWSGAGDRAFQELFGASKKHLNSPEAT